MTISAFLDDALHAVADSFDTLSGALDDIGPFRAFLDEFGWELDPALDATGFPGVRQIFAAEIALLNTMAGADSAVLAVSIPALVASLLRSRTPDPTWPAPLDAAAFWSGTATELSFPRELLDALLYDIVGERAPVGFGLLRFIGVFDEEARPAVAATGDAPARPAYARRAIDWSRLGPAISHPENIFSTVYHWDGVGGAFEHAKLLRNIAALFEGLPVGAAVTPSSDGAYDIYYDRVGSSPAALDQVTVLPLSYYTAAGPTFGSLKLTLNALPIPAIGTRTGQPVGIVLFPLISGQLQTQFALSEGIAVTLRGAYATIPMLAEIRPAGVTFNLPQGAAGTLDAEARVDAHADATPWVLLGSADATRLELAQAHLSLRAQGLVGALTIPEFTIELGIDSAAVVIDFGEGDSFLQRVFGGEAQRAELALAVAWSNKTGFHIRGQERLEVSIPIHQTILDAITLDTIFLALRADVAGRVILEVAISGSFALGPIGATVDRVGLTADFAAASGGSGNLGLVNFDVGFKRPNGAGLAIDASAVTGGGYLFFDTEKEQYAGVLQLQISGITVTAFGLLTTKLPDGKKGFSLFVMITAEGFNPIQLGLGFTLVGVGGLLGVNRTTAVEVLRTGLTNKTLNSLLFPKDAVRNAPQIVSNLNAVFPAAEGRYVLGPVLKLGWSTPTLLTITIALVVEVPSPVRLIILGQLKALLPAGTDEKSALVRLNMDALGVIDFDRGDVALDATIYDSKLVEYPLTGNMALRARWGNDPMFVLAVGGFNPLFPVPAGFPSLSRLAVNLSSGDTQMRLEAYFAVTSNTVQFGARFELRASASGFTLEGFLAFDALFHFDPFEFLADLGGGLALKRDGQVLMTVTVAMTLSGPAPWHAFGKATFEICWIKVTAQFDTGLVGDQQAVQPPAAVDVRAKLLEEFAKPGNWSAQLPAGGQTFVSLRRVTSDVGLLVHPHSDLGVHQRVVPLGVEIARYGNAPVSGERKFEICAVRLNAQPVAASSLTPVTDYFAPATLFELSDDEKLSRPSFESLRAGFRFGVDAVTLCTNDRGTPDCIKTQDLVYDTFIVDDDALPSVPQPASYQMPGGVLEAQASAGPAARAPLRRTGPERYRAPERVPIAVRDTRYVVGSSDDLSVRSTKAVSYTEAVEELRAMVRDNLEERGKLQVVGSHEPEMV